MATYRYNVIVDVNVNTSGVNAGKGQVAGHFRSIETEAARASAKVQKEFSGIDRAVTKTSGGFGMLGQAFKGAFVGAIAGMTFSTIIGGITSMSRGIVDLGVASIKTAADFQMTINAMTLFTGSTSSARNELASLAQLAIDTPGLRMEEAQVGATRLRALGFEAKVASDLVAGIAKQRLVSGVNDTGATDRVIVNLQQLRAGSPQIQRDIQQMILSIPSLSREITKAFGSIEKFKAALRTDSGAAISKFAESLKNAQAPALGFNEYLGILMDSFTEAGRAFGEPILDPLTIAMKDLTLYIRENQSAFASWGQSTGDWIRGVTDWWSKLNAAREERQKSGVVKGINDTTDWLGDWVMPYSHEDRLRQLAELKGKTYEEFIAGTNSESFTQAGARLRAEKERKELERFVDNNPRMLKGMADRGFTVDFGAQTDTEIITQQAKAQADAASKAEAARKQDLDSAKRYQKETLAVSKSRYDTEAAMLDSFIRRTSQDELVYARSIGGLKRRRISDELKITESHYDSMLKLVEANTDEERDLLTEKFIATIKLNGELKIQEYESAKAIAEAELRIFEERRRARLDYNNLLLRASEQTTSALIFNIERQITENGSGYDTLIDVTRQSLDKILAITSDSLRIQLEDQSLSAEQRVNIEKEASLEIERLTEETRQKVLAIEDRKYQAQIDRMDRFAGEAKARLDMHAGLLGSVGGIFGGGLIDQGTVANVGNALGIGRAQALQNQIGALKSKRESGDRGNEFVQTSAEIDALTLSLTAASGALSANNVAFYETIKAYAAGEASIESFQAAQLRIFDDQTALRMESYNVQIDRIRDKITLAADAGKTEDVRRFTQELNQMIADQTGFLFDQSQARAKIFAESIVGMEALLAKLKASDPATMKQMNDMFRGENLLEQTKQYENIARLKYEIANGPYIDALKIEEALLKDILALRNEEQNALIEINQAQLLINRQLTYSENRANASVMQFLASQKGITEIVSDTKISLITSAYSAMENVIGRLTAKMGFFGDAVKELLSGLLKLALNRVFQGLFGIGGGSGSRSGSGGGGFNLGGIFGGGRASGGAGLFGGIGSGSSGAGGGLLGGGAGGGLLGGGGAAGSAGGGGLLSGILGGLGAGLPIIGGGLGSMVGGSSIGGQLMGGLGGVLGGVAALGGLLTAFSGTAVAAGTASALGVGLTGTILAAAPFAAIAAPLLIVGAYFMARSAARRRDEKTRDRAMGDALKALDKLIADVDGDRIDGSAALDQANQVRAQYVEAMSQLKEKKTRNIALKDVARLDAKIGSLKSAIAGQNARRDRLELMVPTFAAGGSVRRNPMGLQSGQNVLGYFPEADQVAMFNERGSEYIFDAQTTRNIGTNNLDMMRTTQGRSFHEMRKRIARPKFATGGSLSAAPSTGISLSDGSAGPMTLELNINVGLSQESFAEVVSSTIKGANGSREQLTAIVNALQTQGANNPVATLLAKQIREQAG